MQDQSTFTDENNLPKKCSGAIQLWKFEDAPEHLRALSDNGGDEDWLALIPAKFDGYDEEKPDGESWLYSNWKIPFDPQRFGRSSVDLHRLANGDVVLIGAHS